MCRAVKFHFDEREWQVRFAQPKAQLPVRDRQASVILLPWGRRPTERGKLPVGGWARFTHLQGGRWDEYNPKPVRILVSGFAATDVTGAEQWFGIPRGQFIRGLAARMGEELRIYIVTLDASPQEAHFESWPRVLSAPT